MPCVQRHSESLECKKTVPREIRRENDTGTQIVRTAMHRTLDGQMNGKRMYSGGHPGDTVSLG